MQSTDNMFSEDKNVVKVKKSRLWIGIIAVLIVIFLVGILSGVLSAKHERNKVEEEYANAKAKRDKGMFLIVLLSGAYSIQRQSEVCAIATTSAVCCQLDNLQIK